MTGDKQQTTDKAKDRKLKQRTFTLQRNKK